MNVWCDNDARWRLFHAEIAFKNMGFRSLKGGAFNRQTTNNLIGINVFPTDRNVICSQLSLADIIGLETDQVLACEAGRRRAGAEDLSRFCAALDVGISYFYD